MPKTIRPLHPSAMRQRVWIELDPPFPKEPGPADHTLGHKRAALMTAMLKRLCEPGDQAPTIEWNEKRLQYQKVDGAFAIQGLEDHGSWFNLDYLGRPA